MQRQCYLTCTWAVFCRCYINTVKSVLTTWHKPTNNKQMQSTSSVLELQRCTEAVLVSHGHIMLWDVLDIFHICRETKKLILYTARLLQTWELEQILARQELQVPALTCQATVREDKKDWTEPEFTLNVLPVWKGKIKTTCWQKLNKAFLIAGHKGKFMSYSPWQHLGSVTFAASTLSSSPFSLSYPSAPTVLPWVLPTRLSMKPGICRWWLHQDVCTSLMSPPCSNACYTQPMHTGFRFSVLRGATCNQASLLFSKLSTAPAVKSLKPPTWPSPLSLYLAGLDFSLFGYWKGGESLPMAGWSDFSLENKL